MNLDKFKELELKELNLVIGGGDLPKNASFEDMMAAKHDTAKSSISNVR